MTSPIVIPVPHSSSHATTEPLGKFSICCAPVSVEDYPLVHHLQDVHLHQLWTPQIARITTARAPQLAAEVTQQLHTNNQSPATAPTSVLARVLQRTLAYISQPDTPIYLPHAQAAPPHEHHDVANLLGISADYLHLADRVARFIHNTQWPEGSFEGTIRQAELRQRILAFPHDKDHYIHLDDQLFTDFHAQPSNPISDPAPSSTPGTVDFDVVRIRGKNTLAVHSPQGHNPTAQSMGWSWGPAQHRRTFLPGITYQGVVITRPQWRFDFAEKNDFSLRTWLHHHDLLGFGYVTVDHERLVLDLRCKHHIPIALAGLAQDNHWIRPAPHVTELGALKSPQGRHVTSLRITGD